MVGGSSPTFPIFVNKENDMEIFMWFCIGCLIGLAFIVWIFLVGIVFYFLFGIAFDLFEIIGLENPFLVIYKWLKRKLGE